MFQEVLVSQYGIYGLYWSAMSTIGTRGYIFHVILLTPLEQFYDQVHRGNSGQ